MPLFPSSTNIISQPPFGKFPRTNLLNVLLLVFLLFVLNKQVHAKSSIGSSTQAREKTGKIVGPFVSREDIDEYTKVVLKNGLTAIIFERRDVPLSAFTTYVKAGFLKEVESQKGVADLIRHSVLLGRKFPEGASIIQQMGDLGALFEAGTFANYTHYTALVPSNSFRKGMKLIARAIRNPDFSEDTLLEGSASRLLESRITIDDPLENGLERLHQLMFPFSSISRYQTSDECKPTTFTSDELKKFHQTWYVPGNIILVICGNVDRRQALDEVVGNYGDMVSTTSDSAAIPAGPTQTILRYQQIHNDTKHPLILVGFQSPTLFSREWYACKVIQAMIAEGRGAKLRTALLENHNLLGTISHHFVQFEQQGALSFSISAPFEHREAVEAALFIELERLGNGQFEDGDVDRAKNLLERAFYLEQEDLVVQSQQLARFEDNAKFAEWRSYVSKIRAVKRSEILQCVRNFFTTSRANLVESLPDAIKFREVSQLGVQKSLELAVRAKVQESQVGGSQDEEKPKASKPARRDSGFQYRKPSGELTSAWVSHELTSYTILRGPEVFVKQSQALPIISLGVFFPGGLLDENDGNSGVTELMLRVAATETLRLGPTQIVAEIEARGAELQTVVDRDFCGYVLTGIKTDFTKSLDALAAILAEPRFEEKQIEIEKRQMLFEKAVLEENMEEFTEQLFYRTLFAKHPYGLPSTGTEESLRKVKRTELSAWHSRHIRSVSPIIVVAGDTEGSEIVSTLTGKLSLSGRNATETQTTEGLQPLALKGEKERILRQSRHHSYIIIGGLAPPANSRNLYSMNIARELISGAASRLQEGARIERLLPVDIRASYEPSRLNSMLYIGVSTISDLVDRVMATLKAQLVRMRNEAINQEEFKRATLISSTRETSRWQHRATQVSEYAKLKMMGMGLAEMRNHLGNYQEVGREDVREAIKSVDADQLVVVGIRGIQ